MLDVAALTSTVVVILAAAFLWQCRALATPVVADSADGNNDWLPSSARKSRAVAADPFEEMKRLVSESPYFDEATAPAATRIYSQSLQKHKDAKHRGETMARVRGEIPQLIAACRTRLRNLKETTHNARPHLMYIAKLMFTLTISVMDARPDPVPVELLHVCALFQSTCLRFGVDIKAQGQTNQRTFAWLLSDRPAVGAERFLLAAKCMSHWAAKRQGYPLPPCGERVRVRESTSDTCSEQTNDETDQL